jgi:hypothetical protein
MAIPRPVRLQDRVPLDEITADARQAKPGRAVLALIGGLLFMIGWCIREVCGAAFLAGAWTVSAVKLGWRAAAGEALNKPDLQEVLNENRRLRLEIERLQLGGMG